MITPEQFAALTRQLDSIQQQQAEQSHQLAELAVLVHGKFLAMSEEYTSAIQSHPNALKGIIDRAESASALSQLVDINQASALTGRAISTLYSLASSGKLTAVKSGGRLRFTRETLEAFINHPRPVSPSKKAVSAIQEATEAFINQSGGTVSIKQSINQ